MRPLSFLFARLATALVLGLGLLAFAGCGGNGEEEGSAATDASDVETVAFVNTHCPGMPDHEIPADAIYVEYEGHNVGFCCEACKPKWEEMTADQKDQFISDSLAAAPGDKGDSDG